MNFNSSGGTMTDQVLDDGARFQARGGIFFFFGPHSPALNFTHSISTAYHSAALLTSLLGSCWRGNKRTSC